MTGDGPEYGGAELKSNGAGGALAHAHPGGMVVGSAPEDLVDQVQLLIGRGHKIDEALLDALFRGWSVNTRRAFRSDIALWSEWCRQRQVSSVSAGPGEVVGWIVALVNGTADRQAPRAMATIERYLVNVGRAYRLLKLDDPTAVELVKLELRAVRKDLGVRQRQALGLRFKGDVVDLDGPSAPFSLANLLKGCGRDVMGARDAALLRIAYDTAARRSELVAIEVPDIEGPDSDGAGVLHMSSSKTDRDRAGADAYLSRATMTAIARWRKVAMIDKGPLLRRVITHFDGSFDRVGSSALHPNSVTLIFKRVIRTTWEKGFFGDMSEGDLERRLRAVSSHSIRVGVAQDSFAAGESIGAIMQSYRWRDARTVMRYGSKLSAKSGTSARLAMRFEE